MRVVLYESKYGYTERFARWIAKDLNCDIYETTNFNKKNLKDYDTIILGGGIYAGKINGVNFINNYKELLKNKRLIFFTVGLMSVDNKDHLKKIKDKAFDCELNGNIEFFYLRGGIDYSKLSFVHKAVMGTFKKVLATKKNRSEDDQFILDTYGKKIDFTDKKYIEPIVNCIKQKNNI